MKSLGWTTRHSMEESINAYWEYIHGEDSTDEILDFAEKRMKQLQVIRKTQATPP